MNLKLLQVALVHREALKAVLLTQHQVEILKCVDVNEGITARKLADKFKKSVACSSQTLKLLSNHGYLVRTEHVSTSGGIEFRYTLTVGLRPHLLGKHNEIS